MFNQDKYFSNLKTFFLGRNLTLLDVIGSTNDYLLDLESSSKDIVLALNQTNGKGRSGRNWFSYIGGLAFSISLCNLKLDMLLPLNIVVAYALADTLRDYGDIKIKWPNDCMIIGKGSYKKVAGILINAKFNGELLDKLIVGIGINLKKDKSDQTNLCSIGYLEDYTDKDICKEIILSDFLNRLELMLDKLYDNKLDIVTLWKDYSLFIGKNITVNSNNGILKSKEININKDGSLLAMDNFGNNIRINWRDIGYDFSNCNMKY